MSFLRSSSAEYEILPATRGVGIRAIVAAWRLLAAFWAILATCLVGAAMIGPMLLFAVALVHGKNPFQARLLALLGSSLLAIVAFCFGAAAIRSYALLVSPTRLISLQYLTPKDFIAGLVFSVLGAAAVYIMWSKPEEKLIYSAYVLFGVVVFSVYHVFRKRG
jgi:hypothetical protein